MYLLFITFGLCATYFILYFLFSIFFKNTITRPNHKSVYSIIYVVIFSLLSYLIVYVIPNEWWSDRVLHLLGGGAVSFFLCFLVVKDSKLNIGRFQFFIFSFLIVTALGVGNEIIEFFLQHYFNIIFASTVTDTWLDLISNLIGTLIAAAVLVPFIKNNG